jgi:AraC-like DNA-binding protein
MANAKLPIYRDGQTVLTPDTCESVAGAVETGQLRLEALSRGQYPGRRLPRGLLPGLSSIGFWDARHDQRWGTGWHYNEGLELSLLESGPLTFSVADRQFELRPGDASVTRPWLRHSLGNPCVSAARAYWLILDVGVRAPGQPWRWPRWVVLSPTDQRELAAQLQNVEVHVWRANFDLRRCFERLGQAVATDRKGDRAALVAVLVNEALVLLLDALRAPQTAKEPADSASDRVERFWQHLSDDPTQLGTEWTLKKMAAACGLGKSQFITCTRKITNLPPLHYLRLRRLEATARWLLVVPPRSVVQIALAAGFGSGAYFAKVFREHFGCTPNIYRLRGGVGPSPARIA